MGGDQGRRGKISTSVGLFSSPAVQRCAQNKSQNTRFPAVNHEAEVIVSCVARVIAFPFFVVAVFLLIAVSWRSGVLAREVPQNAPREPCRDVAACTFAHLRVFVTFFFIF